MNWAICWWDGMREDDIVNRSMQHHEKQVNLRQAILSPDDIYNN